MRQYRSDVYDNFRQRPKAMVDRQEAWYRIWSQWEKAGSPPEQQDRLMDWLAAAIKVSSKNAIAALPPDPVFDPKAPLVPDQLVKQLSQPPDQAPATNPPASKPPAEPIVPGPAVPVAGPLPLRVPEPRRAIIAVKQPATVAAVRPTESLARLPVRAEAPPAIVPPLRAAVSIASDDPGKLTVPPRPLHLAMVLAIPSPNHCPPWRVPPTSRPSEC